MRKLFQNLNEQGKTIFLSSHILSELEKVASHIGIIEEGKMIFQGTKSDLLKQVERHIHLHVNDSTAAVAILTTSGFLIQHKEAHKISVKIDDDQQFNALLKCLIQNGIEIYEIESLSTTLEQIFIKLISRAND